MIGGCIWLFLVLTGLASVGGAGGAAGWHLAAKLSIGSFRAPWTLVYSYAVLGLSIAVSFYYIVTGILHYCCSACRGSSDGGGGKMRLGYESSKLTAIAFLHAAMLAVSTYFLLRPGTFDDWHRDCDMVRRTDGPSQGAMCMFHRVFQVLIPAACAGWLLVFIMAALHVWSYGGRKPVFDAAGRRRSMDSARGHKREDSALELGSSPFPLGRARSAANHAPAQVYRQLPEPSKVVLLPPTPSSVSMAAPPAASAAALSPATVYPPRQHASAPSAAPSTHSVNTSFHQPSFVSEHSYPGSPQSAVPATHSPVGQMYHSPHYAGHSAQQSYQPQSYQQPYQQSYQQTYQQPHQQSYQQSYQQPYQQQPPPLLQHPPSHYPHSSPPPAYPVSAASPAPPYRPY